jgi:formate hydrogenlyase transcriptional activator
MGALPKSEAVPRPTSVEDRLRLVIDAIPCLILRAAPDGAFDFINQRWLEFTGFKIEEVQGWGWRAAVHPEDAGRVVSAWRAGLAAGEPFEHEARIRRVDGEYRWFLMRNVPLRDEFGNIIQWYGTGHDIEDLKQAEDRLQLVIDTTPALLHSARPDGDIDFFNKRMLDYLGVPLEDLYGWRWTNIIHPDDVGQIVDKWRVSLATGEPFESEARVRRADGKYCWQFHRKVPLRDQTGNIVKWFGSSIEIDDRKRAEDALRKSFNEIKALKDQLYKENLALKEEIDQASMFEEIVGSSEKLRRVLAHVAKVAPTDSTVLITGETGTGKELVARAIHKRSRRATRAFVSVNCAAIPPSLVASELFGYEKGAFTGATQRRLGRFEVADGGTIFLDEIGELPSETQVALLRVLQERTFERVGGSQPVTVNVRVVAATNRDLHAAVEVGAFRQDLFYRLNVFPLNVPPLRDRIDDIPILVEYLTERYARKAGKKIERIKKQTLELFRAYDWPGNVRELQNVIERAVILCDGDTLVVDETWLQHESPSPNVATTNIATRGLGRLDMNREKEMIESALTECRGRVSGQDGAAAKLGIPRSTLESRIRSLKINKHRFKSL